MWESVCVLTWSFLTCLDISQRNVCYVLWWTDKAFLAARAPTIVTVSKRLLPQAHHPPLLPPSLDTSTTPSVGKPHWNVFKRHNNSNKQASSSTGADNGGKLCVSCTSSFFLETTKFVYVLLSICVTEPFLISEQWIHKLTSSNQYKLSSNTKRVKRSIPPQHDKHSSQTWLI